MPATIWNRGDWATLDAYVSVCKGTCLCGWVPPYACLPGCIFIGMDRARQNRTTADLLSGFQSARLLTRGQWWAYRRAHVPRPSPTPLSPPLTSSPGDWSPSLCPVQSGSAAQTMPFPPQWTSMLFPQTFPGPGLKGTHRYGIWSV